MKNFIVKLISTFFFIGKIPFMPGTFGSLAATILVAIIFYQPYIVDFNRNGNIIFGLGAGYINPDYIIYIISLLAFCFYFIGVWASDNYSKLYKKEDPKEVVIDEVAGIFTAFSLVSLGFALLYSIDMEGYIIYFSLAGWYFPIVFILFRIFDILKPLHVGWADKNLDGGLGIMMDDIIAGVYSAVAFFIMFFTFKLSGFLDSVLRVE